MEQQKWQLRGFRATSNVTAMEHPPGSCMLLGNTETQKGKVPPNYLDNPSPGSKVAVALATRTTDSD